MQQDMIPPLEHIDATSVEDAVDKLREYGNDAATIAGNTDEINWMKNRMRKPKYVVDIKSIDALSGISERGNWWCPRPLGGWHPGSHERQYETDGQDSERTHVLVSGENNHECD